MGGVRKMDGVWKMFIVILGLSVIVGCNCKPTKDNEQNEVTTDEKEIEEVEDSGTAEDKNPFDILEKINEAHDLTGLYQGDILIMKDKTKLSDIPGGQEELDEAINEKRNVRNDKRYLWTGKVVPFVIDPSVQHLEHLLKEAMNEISNKTCIKFKKRDSETNYIKFFQGQGCYSYIGRYFSGINTISIGNGCNQKGIIQHEILHSLGFWHEQARSDRDKYIEIYWENIKQGTVTNFQKAENQEMLTDYDYNSVMHYGPYSFSANGKKTIVPISNPNANIGQRDGMSPQDIIEINALYDCQSTSTDFYSTWGNWQPCNSDCIKQRQRFCSHTDLTKCPNVDHFGVETVLEQCTHDECYKPVDGHWGPWSSWTACSQTCDWGKKTRSRVCNEPAPKNGGKSCVGAAEGTSNCKKVSCNLGPDDCEFENGLCSWVNVKIDQLDWTRRSGSTPSKNTGPSGDHTSGDGYYMFLEASSPAATGNIAILESKTMNKPASGKKCLIFWNHMYGEWMGELKVKIKDIATGKISILRTLKGNKGNIWNKEEVLFVVNGDFKIQFEAERGASFSSDMAIDDIYFKDGSCNPENKPLGMEDKRIKDWQISASSHWDNYHNSFYARLNQPGPNQWCASWNKHGTDQYVRVDFDKRQLISGVAVQGQATYDNWVTTYKVKYTEDSYTWNTYQENGVDKIFTGPTDRNTPARQNFNNMIRAFGIMINPQTYHGNDICMRIEIYGNEDPAQPAKPTGCKNNVKALGMASRQIPDSNITATSIWDSDHQAYNGRLNNFKVWCAYPKTDYSNEYFNVDFGKPMKIFAVATQGQQSWNNYVTSYEITYGLDGTMYYNIPKDYVTFQPLILTGNSDQNGIVKHKLPFAITARYVRIHPIKFHGADVCMRAEFYGCEPV